MQKNLKLLLVDDDIALTEALKLVLVDEGYSVTRIDNGLDALSFLKKSASPNLVIMDYRLPGLDGLSVVRKMREQKHLQKLPVIIVSASANLGDEVQKSGANQFLAKPFDIQTLLSLITKLTSN